MYTHNIPGVVEIPFAETIPHLIFHQEHFQQTLRRSRLRLVLSGLLLGSAVTVTVISYPPSSCRDISTVTGFYIHLQVISQLYIYMIYDIYI